MRQHFYLVVLAGAVLFSSALRAANNPISVTEVDPTSQAQKQHAVASFSEAAAVVSERQISWSSAALVTYEDRAALGLPSNGRAWLMRTAVQVANGDLSRALTLNVLIDEATGRLMNAYTLSDGEWPTPVYPSVSLDERIEEFGWSMGSDIPSEMESSVVDVIAAAWQRYGADPNEVREIIVRPRWITPRFPAHMENDKMVPIRPTQKVWIVQLCGVKLLQDGDKYVTQRFIQLEDRTLKFAWGFFLP